MCLAIVKPGGIKIKQEYLKNGWDSNDHGAGFCYPNEDHTEVIIKKGFFSFDSFLSSYREHPREPMLIHFRWATHGLRDANNTHPWPIMGPDGKVWYGVIHNGIISNVPFNKEISDTGVFTQKILAPVLLGSNLGNPEVMTAIKLLIEDFLGTGNKVAIMDREGNHLIFNETSGSWDKKCWWSNSCWLNARNRRETSGAYYGGYTPPAQGTNIPVHHRSTSISDIALSKDTINYHIKAAVGETLANRISARAAELMEQASPIEVAYIDAISEIAPDDFGVPTSERKQSPQPTTQTGNGN